MDKQRFFSECKDRMGVIQKTPYLLPIGLFLASLTIRVVLFGLSGEMDLESGDTPSFIAIARSLAEGHGYSLDGGTPTAIRMPLYPIFLAGVFSIPNAGIQTAVIFQLILGSFTIMMLFLLARSLLPPGYALLSGILLTCYIPLVYMDMHILSENLFTFFLVASLFPLVNIRRGMLPASVSGLLMGMAALTRPNGYIVVVFIAMWLWISGIPRRLILTFFLSTALIVSPWIFRNAIQFHRFIPTYTLSGLAFYNSFAVPEKGLSFNSLEGVPDEYFELKDEGLKDAFLFSHTLRYIRTHPGRAVDLIPVKLALLVYPFDMEWLDPRLSFRYNFFWGFLLSLASIGGATMAREIRRKLNFLAPFFLSLLFTTVIFYGSPRLRMPFDPLMAIPALFGLQWLREAGSRRIRASVFIGMHVLLFIAGESRELFGWLRGVMQI